MLRAPQHLVRPWSDLNVVTEIKQIALKSVAALYMNGLTAHLLFKLLTQDGKISTRSVTTNSFFQCLNHARQPALATIYGYPYPDFKSSIRLLKYVKPMLTRLCAKVAMQLNPNVAQITMPTSPQEVDSYFDQLVKSTAKPTQSLTLKPTQSLTLWAYIWKCICDFFNWIIEKFFSVTNRPMNAQAFS